MGSMIAGVLGEIDDSLERNLPGQWATLFGSAHRAVSQRHQWRALRHGAGRDGPFYCPPTSRFFSIPDFSVRSRPGSRLFGQCCKFTAAYIIAHEAGHHIQNLLGILPRVTRLQQQAGSKAEANALQVKSSCRPIASQASGSTARRRNGRASSKPATSTRR